MNRVVCFVLFLVSSGYPNSLDAKFRLSKGLYYLVLKAQLTNLRNPVTAVKVQLTTRERPGDSLKRQLTGREDPNGAVMD